jgi:uncharacterized protein YuzE
MIAGKGVVIMNVTCLVVRAKYGHKYRYPKTPGIGVGDDVWINTSKKGDLISIEKKEDQSTLDIPPKEYIPHEVDYEDLFFGE